MGDMDLSKWFGLVIDDIKRSNCTKIIVDLRGNTGGNSKYFSKFYEKIKDQGYLFTCLIDRGVFSSGVFAFNDMINLGSYIIGEQIGTTQNHFGYVTMINFMGYDITCSNSEYLLKDGRYIRYKKDEVIPSEIKERVQFEIDDEITENIDDYINGNDEYINRALKFLMGVKRK